MANTTHVIPPEIIDPMDQSIFQDVYKIPDDLSILDFDEILKSDIVKIIPILRAINSLYNGILGVRDRFFMRKVALFIKQYSAGLETQEIREFVSVILADKQFRKRVNEKILILLDRFDDEIKALILAELLKNWVQGNIDWNKFERLAYSVDRTHPSLFTGLYDYYKNFRAPESTCEGKIGGGFYYGFESLLFGSGLGDIRGSSGQFSRCQDALILCQYGLKGLYDDRYISVPADVLEFKERKHQEQLEGLFHPDFTNYEQWLVFGGCISPAYGFKIRKEIIDKIRKQYLI